MIAQKARYSGESGSNLATAAATAAAASPPVAANELDTSSVYGIFRSLGFQNLCRASVKGTSFFRDSRIPTAVDLTFSMMWSVTEGRSGLCLEDICGKLA
mmetsp:Transcript_86529/g.253294  ORF Transcript_86529/g.253294 Transcript_86529/m.253294 type:complete len:100 (+) Transcript_86529:1476-1775(+)